MSILNKSKLKQYLESEGFEKNNQWGAPRYWGEATTFYEKYIEVKSKYRHWDVEVIYFPSEFQGYVTCFADVKTTPANRALIMCGDHNYISGVIKDGWDLHIFIQETIKKIKKCQ